VTERWICSRCFTSAEEAATVCPNCGLPRGAEAPNPAATDPGPDDFAAESAPADEAPPGPVPEPTFVEPVAAAQPMTPESAPGGPPADQERWVCLRCFTSNDAVATACASCGQPRGMEPAVEEAQAWTPPTAPGQGGGVSRFPWRWVGYGVIILIVLGASYFFAARRDETGEVTDAGDMSVFDLQVGDCFDIGTEATEVDTVRAIPCEEPHVYEMFWNGDYPSDEQPTEDEYAGWLEDQCLPAFEDYVGIPYADSLYYASNLSPTKESWDDGDRAFSCYLHNQSETAMTGSAAGAAR
jgi:hypothetical protein